MNADQHGSNIPPQPPRKTRARGERGDLGSALRDVYQATVEEEIPGEMLDLLGKLD